ncbi:glutamate racemase [Candidatus Protochlamydia phocaeensis]|uniref:glutamate racemase n=1 Tax=Candidatus Protochlamydia phocaeensis TaxID=1414722 RepID=UPI000838FD71|nr:glutamate racemase [Candidatus Protochlamydia phocaeensis]
MPELDSSYPIGLFDSGVGGLTVMQEIMRVLPHESLVYFGDTARVPYGNKSRETIIRYSIENAIFLLEKQVKLLVVACNTASAFALPKLRKIFNIPIIGVVEPGAEKAVSVTRNQRIAVLGTKGTIQSRAYQTEIQRLLPHAHIFSQACPLFVPLVEERFLDHPATRLLVKEYLSGLHQQEIDTVLLGCTHYPLLKPLIQQELGAHIHLVDSATTCAEKIASILETQKLQSRASSPSHAYYVSDDPDKFKELGEKLFGQALPHVELLNHEKFTPFIYH